MMEKSYFYIIAKKLLIQNSNPSSWYGVKYNLNIYRGCQHNCIYCDSRSLCYQINNFNSIEVKENAPALLTKELAHKRSRCILGTGSMSDAYIPLEKDLTLFRQVLAIIKEHQFSLHILTKSCLIERDIDLLQDISRNHASVAITITTADDHLSSFLEPGAPISSKRFSTLKELSKNGIITGISLMPVLPFLEDNTYNLRSIIDKASDSGCRFIIPWLGVTLRDRQRNYFYEKLSLVYPQLPRIYQMRFGERYFCSAQNADKLYSFIEEYCDRKNILCRMDRLPWVGTEEQLSLFQ